MHQPHAESRAAHETGRLRLQQPPVTGRAPGVGPVGRRILACDGASQVLRALKVSLRGEGYEVLTAASAKEALRIAAGAPLDAAIIELTLPDGDGLALCRRLRELSKMSILFLSAIDETEQKIGALRAGADDYITKPFNPLEVLARLEAVLRRAQPLARDQVISGAGLEVDLRAHAVRRDGEEVRLTPTEFEPLAVLARNHGRLLTHHELVTAVWGTESGEHSQALRTHIARLRRKLEPGETVQYIRTELGVGFRFDLEAIARVV